MQSRDSYQTYYIPAMQINIACLGNANFYGMRRDFMAFVLHIYTKLTGCCLAAPNICVTHTHTHTQYTAHRLKKLRAQFTTF